MSSKAEQGLAVFQKHVGQVEGVGEWFAVDQTRINVFADATLDHQFIHIDPVKSAQLSPYKVTIAHGFLTLSLIPHLTSSIAPSEPAAYEGLVMGVNYGLDKVRFPAPVRVGSRVRARRTLAEVTSLGPHTLQLKQIVTIEVEGESKPACVAETLAPRLRLTPRGGCGNRGGSRPGSDRGHATPPAGSRTSSGAPITTGRGGGRGEGSPHPRLELAGDGAAPHAARPDGLSRAPAKEPHGAERAARRGHADRRLVQVPSELPAVNLRLALDAMRGHGAGRRAPVHRRGARTPGSRAGTSCARRASRSRRSTRSTRTRCASR